MIFGIGIDIIEVPRVEKVSKKDDKFVKKIFTQTEIDYCRKFKNGAQNFAGRFAVKEAFLKAMGTGWSNGLKFNEIETVNDQLGKPEIVLYGRTKEIFEERDLKFSHVSIAHLKDYATAVVVIEK
ncbi:MAG: holo-ACP synthase [Candidatus Cloacimonetes bacterium]|jgi:holo-[acyl-carrier protein] synthase|nr:holo-ACP synthase [Candidatus Cloacimonadota bacterium]MBT4332859.1 holo-ACP synthase [Candidatus Cloacimonadota bacterium]MBT4575922.1 holo-ACP synthase [Candidatus Cloacimonadota bacterium]MBT5421213.1 holo-ACP synthase [Candidatus Cloacimonadota bacterium]